MNWEALSAVSTALTAVVIFFTAVYAARQVRALNEQSKATIQQIEHLRKSTQLQGMHEILDQLAAPEFTDAIGFILTELPEKLKDETYRREALSRGTSRLPNHREFVVFRTFESIGTCVKFGMIDGGPLYDFVAPTIIESWKALEGLVAEQRREFGIPRLWENFEYIYREASKWRYEA